MAKQGEAVTSEQLATQLIPILSKFVNGVLTTNNTAQTQLDAARKQLASVFSGEQLDDAVAALSVKINPESEAAKLRGVIALAIVHAAGDAGIKLAIQPTIARTKGSTGGGRVSGADMDRAVDAALSVLKGKEWVPTSVIDKSIIDHVPAAKPQSVRIRLQRQGKIESNGKKGSGGAWKLAK